MCFLKHRPPKPKLLFRSSLEQNASSNSYSLSSGASSSTLSGVSSTSASSLGGIKGSLSGPIIYNFMEILRATDNFKSQRLGNSMWKGMLRNTAVVLLKKHASLPDFRNVLRNVGSIHHSNIVKLLGACENGNNIYIVYEFVEGVNLRQLIQNQNVGTSSALSTWKLRIRIALDIAQGLEYLHHHTIFGFIHKHIQSTKIVVDCQLRAKITHFGVAELTGEVRSRGYSDNVADAGEIKSMSQNRLIRSNSIRIVGAPGYMPPEYNLSARITMKYDVYAFGVVLLELLSGKDAMSSASLASKSSKVSHVELIKSVMDGFESKEKLQQWIDPVLKGSYPVEDAYQVVALAKACVDKDPEKRPEMSHVSLKLSKYLSSAEKWEARIQYGNSMMSMSLQRR